MMQLMMMLRKSTRGKWSAPGLVTVFLIIAMFVVFSLETVGLFNKEKNLEFRTTNLEISNLFMCNN